MLDACRVETEGLARQLGDLGHGDVVAGRDVERGERLVGRCAGEQHRRR